MIFKVDFVDSSHYRCWTYIVEADSRDEAGQIAERVVALKYPYPHFYNKLIKEVKIWTEADLDDVSGLDNFSKAVVLWRDGSEDIFETNDDAIRHFKDNGIHYDFSNYDLLKDNTSVGHVFGEGVRVNREIVKVE